jgi:hypothetical protein
VPLVYDFYCFPEHYYQTKYPAPGAPEVAARVRELFATKRIAFADDRRRGPVTVPTCHSMYPKADPPALQLSMPALDGDELLALGGALSPSTSLSTQPGSMRPSAFVENPLHDLPVDMDYTYIRVPYILSGRPQRRTESPWKKHR